VRRGAGQAVGGHGLADAHRQSGGAPAWPAPRRRGSGRRVAAGSASCSAGEGEEARWGNTFRSSPPRTASPGRQGVGRNAHFASPGRQPVPVPQPAPVPRGCGASAFELRKSSVGTPVKPLIRKRLQQVAIGAVAPLALALCGPGAKALPSNAGDPLAVGGSPTFLNSFAGWNNSVFSIGSSIYPFTPYTDPACTPGTGATGCDNPTFAYDNTRVVWAANVSVNSDTSQINPVTTIDQSNTFAPANEAFKDFYSPGGAPSDGGWVYGYVFGAPNGTNYNGGEVNFLGFYIGNGTEIRESHEVSLWDFYTGNDPVNNPPNLLASVTIGPGQTSSVCDSTQDLFCWIQLATPVSLVDGQFYTIGAYGGYSPGTPAPLPLLGAAAAFGMSRKVRQRIRFGLPTV